MTTTMSNAFASAGYVPSIAPTESGVYVHACELPPDYLEQRKMALQAAITTEPRKPRVFHVSQMVERPDELVDVAAFDRDIAGQLQALVSLGDWDPALEYAQLKEWDALCACYERLKHNTVLYAKGVQDQIQRVYRDAGSDGEIPRLQVERLTERLQGLRVQSFYYSRKFKVCLQEREKAVGRSGIEFGPYVSIAERAKKGAQAWAAKRLQRAADLDLLNALPKERQEELLQKVIPNRPYQPRLDGVDGAAHGRPSTGTEFDD